jgi:hypothetical protein
LPGESEVVPKLFARPVKTRLDGSDRQGQRRRDLRVAQFCPRMEQEDVAVGVAQLGKGRREPTSLPFAFSPTQ